MTTDPTANHFVAAILEILEETFDTHHGLFLDGGDSLALRRRRSSPAESGAHEWVWAVGSAIRVCSEVCLVSNRLQPTRTAIGTVSAIASYRLIKCFT